MRRLKERSDSDCHEGCEERVSGSRGERGGGERQTRGD